MTRAIPDVLLERYRLNELPPAMTAAIEREIAGDPAAAERLAALARSDDEIRATYVPPRFVRATRARRSSPRGWLLAGTLAAVVTTMLAVMPRVPLGADPDVRLKGAVGGRPYLTVYRWTAAGSERLADGDTARPGDLLRLGYAPAGRAYGVILSIDGRGTVTLHLPPQNPARDEAVPLTQSPLALLDAAYELDEAPRIERFYLVTAARPFKIAPVLAAARAAGTAPAALPLPSSLEQVTFALQKEIRR
jgi:hypothetical protein